MKKQEYIQPQSKIVKIRTMKMLAASFDGEKATLNSISGYGDGSDAASRGGFWDDEEDY